MLKDLAPKLGLGVLVAGGFSGITAFVAHQLAKVSIRDTLKGRLLDFGKEDDVKWTKRSALLTENKTNLSTALAKIAIEGDNDGSKLKKWCETNSENTFFSNSDPLFKEIVKYCTYTIKDKLNAWIVSNWNGAQNDKQLIAAQDSELSKTMQEIKAKLTAKDDQKDGDALKIWCTKVYDLPFESEQDQNLLDARTYCKLFGRDS